MTTDPELAHRVERINALIGQIEAFPDVRLRAQVQEIVECVLEYHGAAIGRMLALVRQADQGTDLPARLADDELVASVLLLHDLHPTDLPTRVEQSLERVRPFLQSHGGNVELLGVEDGIVRLRMQGSCQGCPSSAATLKSRIEQSILEGAPDVAGIEVEGAAPAVPVAGFVSLEQLSAR